MILAILQARTSSTRLPGKVIKNILDKPMIAHQLERLSHAENLDQVLVATSVESGDDQVEQVCGNVGVECFRGSLNNVLERYYKAATQYKADHIVRLTADCPLADWQVIDKAVAKHLEGAYAYTSNIIKRSYPDGLDVEVIRYDVLENAYQNASTAFDQEHVTPYITERLNTLSSGDIVQEHDLSALPWTVDTPQDFEMVTKVYEALYPENHRFSSNDVLRFLLENPDVRNINADGDAQAKYDSLDIANF